MNEDLKIYKVSVVGAHGVGKTTFCTAFLDRYVPLGYTQSTIGVDLVVKKIGNVKLRIWDTGGRPAYEHITMPYIKNADVVLFMYDVSSIISVSVLNYLYFKYIDAGWSGKNAIVVGMCRKNSNTVAKSNGEAFAFRRKFPHFLLDISNKDTLKLIETRIIECLPQAEEPVVSISPVKISCITRCKSAIQLHCNLL